MSGLCRFFSPSVLRSRRSGSLVDGQPYLIGHERPSVAEANNLARRRRFFALTGGFVLVLVMLLMYKAASKRHGGQVSSFKAGMPGRLRCDDVCRRYRGRTDRLHWQVILIESPILLAI